VKRLLALALLSACTLGVRAEGAFEAEFELEDTRAVVLDLPSTPVSVRACDGSVPESCPNALLLSGHWSAVGASGAKARENATRPAILFDAHEGLARVSADIPLDVEGLVDLTLNDAMMPAALDLEVRTSLGDVDVQGIEGSVLVDTAIGDVSVRGPMRSTGVRVEEGQVHVEGPGAVDVWADDGGVRIEQTAGAAQTHVVAPGGAVELLLGDDADVDLWVRTPGRIRVQTDAFSAVSQGLYRARSGTGATQIEIDAGGDVSVRLRE